MDRQSFIWVVVVSLMLVGCIGGTSGGAKATLKAEGVKDGMTYHRPVTPKIIILDAGNTLKGLTLNGQDFSSSPQIVISGVNTLEITVENSKGETVVGEIILC